MLGERPRLIRRDSHGFLTTYAVTADPEHSGALAAYCRLRFPGPRLKNRICISEHLAQHLFQ